MDQSQSYYTFISRFLDNDIPTVNANFKEFLVKEGMIQMLICFITMNFPKSVKQDTEKNNSQIVVRDSQLVYSEESLPTTVPLQVLKSYKVMNLFVHPTPPFISLAKEKLPVIISSLFEIFPYQQQQQQQQSLKQIDQPITIVEPKGNIHHFCKVIQCLFSQYTFDCIYALSEINEKLQKNYFQILVDNIHHHPIQDLLVVMSKRAARSVNEYQTTNPMDTKKIQKGLQKSKFYNMVTNLLTRPNQNENNQTIEGCSEFIIKCIEELNIYGPDIGLPFCYFQTKEFTDQIWKMISNESGGSKKGSLMCWEQRQLGVKVINALVIKSIQYAENNEFQAEKDSIFSSSGSTNWVHHFSLNHMPSICKLLLDFGNCDNNSVFKKSLTSFRVEAITLLTDLIKYRSTLKKKSNSQQYIPNELWAFLVDWFFQFNNIYHSKFYNLMVELLSQNHLPSIKYFMTNHLKRFIVYYNDVKNSECRGIILLLCNYIRLTSDSLGPTQFLPIYLKSFDTWQNFLPTLLLDTYKQYHTMTNGYHSQTNLLKIQNSNLETYDLSNIMSKDLSLINLGSDFAESIGFEDEEKKLQHQQLQQQHSNHLMIDELNSDQNTTSTTSTTSNSLKSKMSNLQINGNGDDDDIDDDDDIAIVNHINGGGGVQPNSKSKKSKKNKKKK